MSNLMSAPRKALLEHLVAVGPIDASNILRVTGISPRSIDAFAEALVEEELVSRAAGNRLMGSANGFVLSITDRGRAALAVAVVPEETISRKADDRSAELAKLLANPAIIRANAPDLHRHLIADQHPQEARRNLAHVEELASILNRVIQLEQGRR